MRFTARQLRDLRDAADLLERRLSKGFPDDETEFLDTVELVGALAWTVPFLIDAIEELRAKRKPEPIDGFVKYSATGGHA